MCIFLTSKTRIIVTTRSLVTQKERYTYPVVKPVTHQQQNNNNNNWIELTCANFDEIVRGTGPSTTLSFTESMVDIMQWPGEMLELGNPVKTCCIYNPKLSSAFRDVWTHTVSKMHDVNSCSWHCTAVLHHDHSVEVVVPGLLQILYSFYQFPHWRSIQTHYLESLSWPFFSHREKLQNLCWDSSFSMRVCPNNYVSYCDPPASRLDGDK